MYKIFKKQLGEKLDIINCGDIKLFQDGAFHDFPLSMRGLASTDIFNDEEKKAFGLVLVDILKLKVENLFGKSIQKIELFLIIS